MCVPNHNFLSCSSQLWRVHYPKNPEWWQSDETPKNEMGKKLTFICQIDMYAISKDDCRMFIFYDKENRIIKNICQWD